MPKEISIKKVDEQYLFFCDNIVIFTIPKNNLTIEGKSIFDNLVAKLDITQKIEFIFIDDATIKDSNELRILKDVKTLLISIAAKINAKFALTSEKTDEDSEQPMEHASQIEVSHDSPNPKL